MIRKGSIITERTTNKIIITPISDYKKKIFSEQLSDHWEVTNFLVPSGLVQHTTAKHPRIIDDILASKLFDNRLKIIGKHSKKTLS